MPNNWLATYDWSPNIDVIDGLYNKDNLDHDAKLGSEEDVFVNRVLTVSL